MLIETLPLTVKDFAPYGQVISARTSAASEANQGTASRFNNLATIQNGRSGAKSNVCLFRSAKRPLDSNSCSSENKKDDGSGLFRVKLLERHPYSSQMFVPINCQNRWLIIVALSLKEPKNVDVRKEGNAGPDMSTVRAFMATSDQGINFAAGVWHHPLIALESTTDFACVVYEDGTRDDCHIVNLNDVSVIVPPRCIDDSRKSNVCRSRM
jgi:ureidoglycolate hydrolase